MELGSVVACHAATMAATPNSLLITWSSRACVNSRVGLRSCSCVLITVSFMFEFTCRFEIWSMSPDHIFILADHPIPPGSKAPPVSSGTGQFSRPTVSAECNGAPSPGCVFETRRQLSAECTRAPSTRRIPTVRILCQGVARILCQGAL